MNNIFGKIEKNVNDKKVVFVVSKSAWASVKINNLEELKKIIDKFVSVKKNELVEKLVNRDLLEISLNTTTDRGLFLDLQSDKIYLNLNKFIEIFS